MRFQITSIFFLLLFATSYSQEKDESFAVIGYYAGGPEKLDSFQVEKLTHIIFSFCRLKENKLFVRRASDSLTIQKMVALKKRNPQLKVMLSLGGWGGCEMCSDVFSNSANREEFSKSVKELNEYFGTDGIDLDWEYPAIEGLPGHKYKPEDKQNFTELVTQLRKTLGNKYEISFAAGGFNKFLEQSIDWEKVMKQVDRVNLMSYDLVNGYSTTTGHHTPLFSTPQQSASTDNAIQYLTKIGVPASKIVIGAAFYARIFENVPATNNGLYQSCKFKTGVGYADFEKELSVAKGFNRFWDDVAKAPYMYNVEQKLFVTYDDKRSLQLKTQYVADQKLNGIMFWQLGDDTFNDGLLETIDTTKKSYISTK